MKDPLRSRSMCLLTAVVATFVTTGGAGAQTNPSAADTLAPDMTVVVRTDAEGRMWVDDYSLGERGGRQVMVSTGTMAGPMPGTGSLGFVIHLPNHPDWHGRPLRGENFAPEQPVVRSVRPGSLAEAVGLRPGDVVLAVDGTDARETAVWRDLHGGRVMSLRIRRGGEERNLRVAVSPSPSREAVERTLRLRIACLRRGYPRAANDQEFTEITRACDRAYDF